MLSAKAPLGPGARLAGAENNKTKPWRIPTNPGPGVGSSPHPQPTSSSTQARPSLRPPPSSPFSPRALAGLWGGEPGPGIPRAAGIRRAARPPAHAHRGDPRATLSALRKVQRGLEGSEHWGTQDTCQVEQGSTARGGRTQLGPLQPQTSGRREPPPNTQWKVVILEGFRACSPLPQPQPSVKE